MSKSSLHLRRLSLPAMSALALGGSLGALALPASASPIVVDHFGANGWYSSDTRDSSGTNLYGTNDTQPYLITLNGGAVSGDDAKIEQQIGFVPGPAGSLDNKGAVSLYATNQNQGKANLSIASTSGNGLGVASNLLSSDFYVSLRDYNQPDPTSRTVGISIGLTNGTDVYTLSYLNPTNLHNTWQTFTATASSNSWRLYGNGSLGAAPGGGTSDTLANWANDATFGSVLGTGFHVYEIGFNLGSYQRNNYTYVDWFQSSLVSQGTKVDFQAAHPAPEPGSLALFGAGLLGLMGLRFLRRKEENN